MTVSVSVLSAGYCTCPGHLARGRGSWRSVRFPALFALVQHPRFGSVLFDTGYSTEFFRASRRLPYRLYRALTPVTLREEEAAVHQLAARGLRPGDIDHVLISHFHADHVSALKDFPRARYRYLPEAFAHVRGRRGWRALAAAFLPDLLPADFDDRAQPLGPAGPLPSEYAPFTRGIDFFGDESVWVVALPGHAPGQFGLLARAHGGRDYFLLADACWHSAAYRDDHPPHPLASLLFSDRAAYRRTLGQLHQLHRRAPQLALIPSHCDEAAWRYAGQPPPEAGADA